MKVDFTVASVRKGHVAVNATIGDAQHRVLVDGLEVDLVTDTGRSLTLPFYGSDLSDAEQKFQAGNKVSMTLETY